VTISFENWKEGKVSPATFELDVPPEPVKSEK
jgi:hypothetical protein